MQAIIYRVNPVGWATCKWLKHFWRGCLLTRLNGLSLRQLDPLPLPGEGWVRARPLISGICGSDVAILAQRQPPDSILQAFCSLPAIFGHENVSVVDEVGPGVDPSLKGRRVCVEPTLCCEVRGIDPPCDRCKEGQYGACENFGADGLGRYKLPPGSSIGYNGATGGAFGESFVAHVSQLMEVNETISDEQAVLIDPVACSLHAVLRANLDGARSALIYGTGMLGLGAIAALRATGYAGRIDTLVRYDYQGRLATSLGVDNFLVLPGGQRERFDRIAEMTGGTIQRARFGNYMLSGGYDVIFDCVGSKQSIEESLKWTRARGQVVMVATGHGRGADMTPIWFRELNVIGAYGRQMEHFAGRRIRTYQLVQNLMLDGKIDVEDLLTHRFPITEYKKAFAVAMNKSAHRAVKVAFDFR